MSTVVKSLKQLVSPKILIKNTWLFGVLTLFLALYGPRLQPKLPQVVRKLFNTTVFRGLIIFLILYISRKDMGTALTTTIIFMVVMNILQTMRVVNNVNEFFLSERFSEFGPPVANCENYKNDKEKTGGPVYKVHSGDAKF